MSRLDLATPNKLSTINSQPSTRELSSRDCAHNKERLGAFCDRVGQGSIRRIVRYVFTARKEPDERSPLLRIVVTNGSAQRRILGLECIENRSQRSGTVSLELHFVADARQRAQMMRKNNANHFRKIFHRS